MDRLTPQDPHRIGQYRLLARLGEGGMGQVFLARSERGRTVAVKTIRSALAREPDFRRRFAQEITAARRVGARWTAPVLDADTDADTPWVATGYIAGPSLHEVVSRDFGVLPERSILLLANGLGHALSDIHGAGLVHRDLKPSNVLLTIDGPRVIDFGIARALEQAPGENLTRTGATVGSPGFMSPEQIRGHRVTPASDIFCLGSLLAYAATGRTPFGALDSGVHILMFRIAEEPPDLDGLPERLRELIAACLTKDPAQRITVPALLAATSSEDASQEPWLPGALVAQLGRHAVELLDSEDPATRLGHTAVTGWAGNGAPAGQQAPAAPRPAAPATPATPTPPTAPVTAADPHTPARGAAAPPPPRPTPVPSPYSRPGLPHSNPGTGPHSLGGFGPASPYASGAGTAAGNAPGRRRRLGPVLAAVAGAVVLVLLGVLVAVQLTGGGGASGDVDEGYIGAWQGDYTGSDGRVNELRFEIRQGSEGEVIGEALALSTTTLCSFDVRLESADEGLRITEESRWSVPENAAGACDAGGTPQTLSLAEDGERLNWTQGDRSAALSEAPESAAEGNSVPASLLGEWRSEGTRNNVPTSDRITIEEGTFGDLVLTFERSENGEHACTWENHLVQVEGREITLGPDVLVEQGSGPPCQVYAGFRLWNEEGNEDTIKILWLNYLDRTPQQLRRV
ncbi:serine/threonine-protein kinase [Streptomyces sp. DSM 44917]|uniref:Serine/threonine-protein kinase n=1 Tax=Streptomyces boetiae TaxID=3075541 RepID=A0ABU2LGG3_9ACTN|nr:serine/threonine-protein kinase [Streptomyces sp. DSM 44917]MDT0310545.1 serine/threonine-protein kinase [Streptomyces sp. DSM 44917]